MLSVKPEHAHQAERRDDRHRDGERRDDGRAQAAEEQQHDERREHRAHLQVLEHLVARTSGSGASYRARPRPRSQRAAGSSSSLTCAWIASTTATVFVPVCLRTCERDRRRTAVDRRGLGVLLGVLDAVAELGVRGRHDDVGDADLVVALLADHDPAELLRIEHAAGDAQRVVARAGIDLTARHVHVRRRDRAADFQRGDARGGEPDRIEVDVDLAVASAEDHDLTDAGEPLDPTLDLLVGEVREVADGRALRTFDARAR